MTYCFRCDVCGATRETTRRENVRCTECALGPDMRRDYRAESVQVDRFALRVGGTRAARAEPMPPDEADKVNRERLSR